MRYSKNIPLYVAATLPMFGVHFLWSFQETSQPLIEVLLLLLCPITSTGTRHGRHDSLQGQRTTLGFIAILDY